MKFTPTIMTACSGRFGDYVASHNRGGPYIRLMGNPNPLGPTEEQDIVRAIPPTLYTLWLTLTVAEREVWSEYSRANRRPGRTGLLRSIGGYPEFCRSNFIRQHINASGLGTYDLVTVPPLSGSCPTPYPMPTAEAFAADKDVIVTFDDAADWYADDKNAIAVYISDAFPDTINYHRSPMTIAGVLGQQIGPSPTTCTLNSLASSAEGNHVFVTYRTTYGTGLLAAPYQEKITVQA